MPYTFHDIINANVPQRNGPDYDYEKGGTMVVGKNEALFDTWKLGI